MSKVVHKADLSEVQQFQANLTEHTIVEDEHGVVRYQANKCIYWLWEHKFLDLNAIQIAYNQGAWSLKEYMQFYRDLGYSLSGFEEVWGEELEVLEREGK